jgi:3-deoxy-manno-octulosonate cytidylyltransferase (CMP-KDO synthetase)
VDAVGVIPARWASSRFPGKPLALIAGKPLLQWVIEGARTSRLLREICVATDDERIARLAAGCGVRAIMTDSNLPTGTDRVHRAALETGGDVVVNIQGDEPLIEGSLLDRLVAPFEENPVLEMATLGRELNQEALQSPHTAKIVLNERHEAIYFSRFPIPYSRVVVNGEPRGALKHIGIYAYRRSFLERFCAQPPTVMEESEGLEQLRALYLGARIKVVRVEHDSWGVDTPEDVQKIERILKQRGEGAKP